MSEFAGRFSGVIWYIALVPNYFDSVVTGLCEAEASLFAQSVTDQLTTQNAELQITFTCCFEYDIFVNVFLHCINAQIDLGA